MKGKSWHVVIILSVLALVLSVGACARPPAAPEEEIGPPEEEIGTIKIGILGPMHFLSGEHQWKGAALAVEEINTAGGVTVGGKRYLLEAIQIDDNSFVSVPDAASAMQRAATVDRVKYVIAGGRTEAVLAQQEIAMDHKILYLGISMSSPPNKPILEDYERYKYYFNAPNCISGHYILHLAAVTYPAVRDVREALGLDRVRVAYLAEKAVWADYIFKLLEQALPGLGCDIVGEWRPSHLTTDVSAELASIKAARAHAIIHIFSAEGGTAVSRQWGEVEFPAALTGVNVPAQRKEHWDVTGGLCNYESYFDWQFPLAITDKTKPYYEAFAKKYDGEFATWTANTAYDGMYVLKEAFETAGSLDTDALVPVMEKLEVVGVSGTIVYLSPDDPMSPHGVKFGPGYTHGIQLQWRDGKQIPYWPDGKELPADLLEIGLPSGWDKAEYEGMGEYVVPPWVVEYWKGKP